MAYVAAPAVGMAACGNTGFWTFETTNETRLLEARLPLVKVTVKTAPRNTAVAAGVPLMPEKAETGMILPETGAVNPVSVTTNRLKLPILEGKKEIEMWQEAPAIGLSVATWTYCKDSMMDATDARLVQSSCMAFAKVAAPTVEVLACGEGGF